MGLSEPESLVAKKMVLPEPESIVRRYMGLPDPESLVKKMGLPEPESKCKVTKYVIVRAGVQSYKRWDCQRPSK